MQASPFHLFLSLYIGPSYILSVAKSRSLLSGKDRLIDLRSDDNAG